MKNNKKIIIGLFGVSVLVSMVGISFIESNPKNSEKHYQPRQSEAVSGYEGAEEYYNDLRSNVNTGKVEMKDIIEGRKGAKRFAAKTQRSGLDLEWVEEGPDNVGGRTRAILITQDDEDIMFAGGVSGGLWKSVNGGNTWSQVEGFEDNLIVASIAQLGNGNIYVGTGSGHDGPSGVGGSGFIGGGLFVSTDDGESWKIVEDSDGNKLTPSGTSTFDDWAIIDELAADPNDNDKLWIAHNGGLKEYNSSNKNLSQANGIPSVRCEHVVVSGSTFLASTGTSVYISEDGGSTFAKESNGDANDTTKINTSGVGRVELAISPDDENFAYAALAGNSGGLKGVFMTRNGGKGWHRIAPDGSSSFDYFDNGMSKQGLYDNAITVVKGNPEKIFVGGITVWEWENEPTTFDPYSGQWEQVATNFGYPSSVPFYIHSDIHEFQWNSEGHLYIGTDGGIFKSENLNEYIPMNRGYNVTQFYSVAYSPDFDVLGGTQDNGTQYIDHDGSTYQEAVQASGGDGFDCDISQMSPSVMFSTLYSGVIYRSTNGSDGAFAPLFDQASMSDDFYTNLRLYEDPNDTESKDSLWYKNKSDDTLQLGDSLYLQSRTLNKKYGVTLHDGPLYPGDSIRVQDRVQSILAFPFNGSNGYGLYWTRDALRLSVTNSVTRPGETSLGGVVNAIEFSADGNHIFVAAGRSGGSDLYRISGLKNSYKSNNTTSTKIFSSPFVITGIAPDPNDPDHLVITLGNYGGGGKVKETTNATTSGAFSSIWTNDPDVNGLPVYDAIIHKRDPNIIIVGTEHGVYATNDGGSSWNNSNSAPLDRVPVFAVRQQKWGWEKGVKNPGVIYLGTHGRGIFKSNTLLSDRPIKDNENEEGHFSDLKVYPNPMNNRGTISLKVADQTNAKIQIFNLNGSVVKDLSRDFVSNGHQELRFNANDLAQGTYFVKFQMGDEQKVAKFMVAE